MQDDILESIEKQKKRMQTLLSHHTSHQEAPAKLMDAILTWTKLVQNHKAKHGEDNDSYRTYKAMLDAMVGAFNYMDDLRWLYEENGILRHKLRTSELLSELFQRQLVMYSAAEEMIRNGKTEEVLKVAQAKIEQEMKND